MSLSSLVTKYVPVLTQTNSQRAITNLQKEANQTISSDKAHMTVYESIMNVGAVLSKTDFNRPYLSNSL